jgi:hypothetical protein
MAILSALVSAATLKMLGTVLAGQTASEAIPVLAYRMVFSLSLMVRVERLPLYSDSESSPLGVGAGSTGFLAERRANNMYVMTVACAAQQRGSIDYAHACEPPHGR